MVNNSDEYAANIKLYPNIWKILQYLENSAPTSCSTFIKASNALPGSDTVPMLRILYKGYVVVLVRILMEDYYPPRNPKQIAIDWNVKHGTKHKWDARFYDIKDPQSISEVKKIISEIVPATSD